MKNIHSYQFCSIIEWSHFPSVVFYLLSLSASLFFSPLSSAIWPSYHHPSNFHTASYDMERLALAVFDIKPLQFSQEKKGRARGGRKLHATLWRCWRMGKISPHFFLKQFQDLERSEINSLGELRAVWCNIFFFFFLLLGNTLVSSLKCMANPLF